MHVKIKVIHTSVIIKDFWTLTFEHTNLRFSAYGSLRWRHFVQSRSLSYYCTCLYTLWSRCQEQFYSSGRCTVYTLHNTYTKSNTVEMLTVHRTTVLPNLVHTYSPVSCVSLKICLQSNWITSGTELQMPKADPQFVHSDLGEQSTNWRPLHILPRWHLSTNALGRFGWVILVKNKEYVKYVITWIQVIKDNFANLFYCIIT